MALAVRVARFQNCYGPEGTWTGGREKAPAAICRKVAEAEDGGSIEVWGDGTAVRSYTYVDDLVDGIVRLMRSDLDGPANIGSPEYVSVRELVETVIEHSGKQIEVRYIPGPVGVQSRNFSNARIYVARLAGEDVRSAMGSATTYRWMEQQVRDRLADGGQADACGGRRSALGRNDPALAHAQATRAGAGTQLSQQRVPDIGVVDRATRCRVVRIVAEPTVVAPVP